MNGMTEEELAGLSDEERAALADDDNEESSLQSIAGQDGGDDKDDSIDDDTADEAKAPAQEAKKADDEQASMPADDAEDDAPVALPQLDAGDPEAAQAEIEKLKALRKDIRAKYTSGELDDEQFDSQLDDIQSKLGEQQRVIDTAAMNTSIAEANKKAEVEHWIKRVEKFMKTTAETEGIDYKGDDALNAALDVTVRKLATEKDKDGNLVNADKQQGWFLTEAHRLIKQKFGMVAVPKGAKAPQAKAPDLSKMPPSIARAPKAGTTQAGSGDDGEFANLDNLSGMDLERAVARMTPDQQARWEMA